jgi:hypothetical protein
LSGTTEKTFPAQALLQICIARSPAQGNLLGKQVALNGVSTVRYTALLVDLSYADEAGLREAY